MTPITRTPSVGETLRVTIRSAGRIEVYLVEVVEVFSAVCRVAILGRAGCRQGIVRVHVSQLSEV